MIKMQEKLKYYLKQLRIKMFLIKETKEKIIYYDKSKSSLFQDILSFPLLFFLL